MSTTNFALPRKFHYLPPFTGLFLLLRLHPSAIVKGNCFMLATAAFTAVVVVVVLHRECELNIGLWEIFLVC